VHMARRVGTRSSPPDDGKSGRSPVPASVAPSEPSRRTPSLLEFLGYVIEDPRRTRRLIALVLTAGACLVAILFVLQLNPDRWASVLAVATSVVAGVLGLSRRGNGKEPSEDP
jgi:hypothetical protein